MFDRFSDAPRISAWYAASATLTLPVMAAAFSPYAVTNGHIARL